MSGSTVDAMADAIDHSHTVLYGVSLECEHATGLHQWCATQMVRQPVTQGLPQDFELDSHRGSFL